MFSLNRNNKFILSDCNNSFLEIFLIRLTADDVIQFVPYRTFRLFDFSSYIIQSVTGCICNLIVRDNSLCNRLFKMWILSNGRNLPVKNAVISFILEIPFFYSFKVAVHSGNCQQFATGKHGTFLTVYHSFIGTCCTVQTRV